MTLAIHTQLTTSEHPKLSHALASEKGVPFGSLLCVLSVQKGAQDSDVSELGKCIVHLESLISRDKHEEGDR